jgi:hypothetical protein
MKKHGYLISAFYYGEQRPISFHLFESEALDFLEQLNDAQELAVENPEYYDILRDFDAEISVMSFANTVYKIEELMYE